MVHRWWHEVREWVRRLIGWGAHRAPHTALLVVASLLAVGVGVGIAWRKAQAPSLLPERRSDAAFPLSQPPAPHGTTTGANSAPSTTPTTATSSLVPPAAPSAVPQHPPITRPVPAGASAQVIAQLHQQEAAVRADPTNQEAWLYLGTYRKVAGDYEGAAEAWNYAAQLAPHYTLPLVNLAMLYGLTLNDDARAQSLLHKARAANPHSLVVYQQAADYLSAVRGNHAAAEAFLREGIAVQPQEAALWLWLGEVLERAPARAGDALYAYLKARELSEATLERAAKGSERYRRAASISAAAQRAIARLEARATHKE